MEQQENLEIDDLIVLGQGVPEEIRDGRTTICTAGYSPKHGFLRVYPTSWNMPIRRWHVIKVPLERPKAHNGRIESWKIVGSRDDWDRLGNKVKVMGEYPKSKQQGLIQGLVSGCVNDIRDSHRSLGIISPKILEHYFEKQKIPASAQTQLDGRFRVKVKEEFPLEPRIKYQCSECKVAKGFHDQQVIEWGAYEWLRKCPEKAEQVWENMHVDDNEYEKYFFVGNMFQYPNSFIVISVFRFKRK
ncbi:MAG: hypothetical protein ABSA75_14770 [Candidatus Bathyarchaeia archaeon]